MTFLCEKSVIRFPLINLLIFIEILPIVFCVLGPIVSVFTERLDPFGRF